MIGKSIFRSLKSLPIISTDFWRSFSADQSEYVEIIPGKEIKIERQEKGLVHIDGEPIELEEDINVQVMPRSLKIIC